MQEKLENINDFVCGMMQSFGSGFLRACNLSPITNYVDKFLAFFDKLPPSVDIFYLVNVDKKSTFMDYLPPSSCKRSL